MSWDIFIQDLPKGTTKAQDIPEDFEPKPLGPRASILATLASALPGLVFDDDGFTSVDSEEFAIEIDIGTDDPCPCVALFVHGGGPAAGLVADLVQRFGGKALDMDSESGIFDASSAQQSFEHWQAYRDKVIAATTKPKAKSKAKTAKAKSKPKPKASPKPKTPSKTKAKAESPKPKAKKAVRKYRD